MNKLIIASILVVLLASAVQMFAQTTGDERYLLTLVNQDRARAGLPALQIDTGLTFAARSHSEEMAAKHQLSHQLSGEPDLQQRVANNSKLQFDETGENVGYAESIERTEDGFMHSPPHRKNLLTPEYNVVGFGIVHTRDMVYVTEDFGHALPGYSADHARNAVIESVINTRRAARLPALSRLEDNDAQATACDMAKMDSLKTPSPHGYSVLRYTTMRPESLPNGSEKLIDSSVQSFAAGICHSRTATYPTGVYWVVLLFQ
jgi:cysteine-rich secretory family protein